MTGALNQAEQPFVRPAGVDTDDWPPELRLLLGDNAGGLLAAAAEACEGQLRAWSARQVNHQPGRSTVVQYRADIERAGRTTTETIVAATGDRIPEGAAVLDDGTTRVAMWAWPFDPSLPGLAAALDPDRAVALLGDLGLGGGPVSLRMRAYRPGRRAVVEATGPRGRLFLKVVRPAVVQALHGTHRSLAACLPVPDSLGWTDNGTLVLEALPGQTVREALRSGAGEVPSPAAVSTLLDRLPPELAMSAPRRSLVSAAEHHGDVIVSALPPCRVLVEETLAALHDHPLAEDHPTVPVHGDLYEGQLLTRRGRVTGLLDVDTAGSGQRVEDLANFIGHLSVLAQATDRPKPVKRYGAALLAHAERGLDRADLRVRVAAAVIGLATGPFRVLEPNWLHGTQRRLELARAWLEGI